MTRPRESILKLKARMQKTIIGQEHVVERLLIGLLAKGNVLLEGLPGPAKTRAVKALSRNGSGRARFSSGRWSVGGAGRRQGRRAGRILIFPS